MGADMIVVSWTTDESDLDRAAIVDAIAAFPEGRLNDLFAESQSLGPLSEYDFSQARSVLAVGMAEYLLSVDGVHRHTASEQIDGTLWHYTSGGSSWGDDPYENWSELFCFLEACAEDPALARAAGFVGWGAVGADEVTPLMEAFATALEEEGINADMVSRILDRVVSLTSPS